MKSMMKFGIGLVGATTVLVGMAAWAGQGVPEWEHGELRAAKKIVELQFTTAREIQQFETPRDLTLAPDRSRLYALDLLQNAGWQLLEVQQTDREWVYLMRRAR